MKTFEFNYSVRLDDLDYMSIVGNANWLIFMERARIELLQKIDFPFQKMLKRKIGGVVSESNVKYLRPARFGDVLKIIITPAIESDVSTILEYDIQNSSGKSFVKANLKMVFVDETGKPTFIPEEIKARIS